MESVERPRPRPRAVRSVLLSIAAGLAIAMVAMWGFKWYYFHSSMPALDAAGIAQAAERAKAMKRLQRDTKEQFDRIASQRRDEWLLTAAPLALPTDQDQAKKATEETIAFGERVVRFHVRSDFAQLEAAADEARESDWLSKHGEPRIVAFYRTTFPNSSDTAVWRQYLERCDQWRKVKPTSKTAVVATLYALDAAAWRMRQEASYPRPSDVEPIEFLETLRRAEQIANENKQVASADPAYFAKMLDIGRSLGWSKTRMLAVFEEGRSVDPGFIPLYLSMAEYLSTRDPRIERDVERFAEKCRDEAGAELGPQIYALIALHVSRQLDGDIFTETEFDFDGIVQGWRQFPPRLRDSVYMSNRIASLAAIKQRQDIGHEAFAVMNDGYDADAWQEVDLESFLELVDAPADHALWLKLPEAEASGALALAFSPNGAQFAAAGFLDNGANVRLGVPVTAVRYSELRPLTGLTRTAKSVAFSWDGKWLAACGDSRHVLIWPTSGDAPPVRLSAPRSGLEQVAFTSDGKNLLAVCPTVGVYVWDLAQPSEPSLIDVGGQPVACAEFIGDGPTISMLSWSGELVRLNLDTGELENVANLGHVPQRRRFYNNFILYRPPALGPEAMLECLAEDDDAEWLEAVYGDVAYDPIHHRLAVPRQVTTTIKNQSDEVFQANEMRIFIWDIPSRTMLESFPAGEHALWALSFSPDGLQLAWASGPTRLGFRDFRKEPLPEPPPPKTHAPRLRPKPDRGTPPATRGV